MVQTGCVHQVITISASYGAGGSVIGPAVAKRLGVPFLDRAVPSQDPATEDEPPSEQATEQERDEGLLERMMSAFASVPDFSSGWFPPDVPHRLVEVRKRAVAAAQGREPFDLLLTGGTVVDVGCGELRAADVGFVGPLIASVHEPGSRGDTLDAHDCTGRFVVPGLIDTHSHFKAAGMCALTPSVMMAC